MSKAKDTFIGIKSKYRYDDRNYKKLLERGSHAEGGLPEALPRRTRYGAASALKAGLVPLEDTPQILIDPKDYKEVIKRCHDDQIFAVYHQKASGVFDTGWNQDGYGFCWAYGLTCAMMDCRALEGRPPIRLAPFSLGWLVGWKNQGFYLDGALAGAKERGIASAEYVPEYNLKPKTFKAGWEDNAKLIRPDEVWDTDPSSTTKMIQHCISILATGRSLYIAHNWWSHALEICGVNWNEKEKYNLEWIHRNSHDEKDVIILTGDRGVPDEAYGIRSTIGPE
jgi:hypothetical protein